MTIEKAKPLKALSPRRRIVKRNVICPYCHRPFGPDLPYENEHVVGRCFVPKGTMAAQWNLLLRACGRCNDAKADLENDLSAITMQPDAHEQYACDDPRLSAEAKRKSRAKNPRTGRFVSEIEKAPSVTFKAPGLTMTFGFVQPAQPDHRRLYLLAQLQLMGFFFWLTFKDEARRGDYWPGDYEPVVAARKEDWGHPHLRWIEDVARDWHMRLHGITADAFYKVWIKRCPTDPPVWAWAMEWNRTYRLAGFFGDRAALDELLAGRPDHGMRTLHETKDQHVRMRREVPLAEQDDTLFAWEDGAEK
jgi:hypothetical protein